MIQAEYGYNALTSSLIREYIWADEMIVAVVENGALYFTRTDHIGRPVFGTDLSGATIWEASYLPFGGVHTVSGTPINLRFPGQWFQSESGLHQNWMRDYDPTLGRYIQADPLGLVDGASVYGYALQNPGRYVDPTGEFIPILIWAVGGMIVGEVIKYAYEACGCDSTASERYALGGALTETFGPTHPKRTRPFGSSAGHSAYSELLHQLQGRVPQRYLGKARRFGQRIAKRIPLLGAAMISYDALALAECYFNKKTGGRSQ